jgi:hypothetical protein
MFGIDCPQNNLFKITEWMASAVIKLWLRITFEGCDNIDNRFILSINSLFHQY